MPTTCVVAGDLDTVVGDNRDCGEFDVGVLVGVLFGAAFYALVAYGVGELGGEEFDGGGAGVVGGADVLPALRVVAGLGVGEGLAGRVVEAYRDRDSLE